MEEGKKEVVRCNEKKDRVVEYREKEKKKRSVQRRRKVKRRMARVLGYFNPDRERKKRWQRGEIRYWGSKVQ